ncbi:MAG: PQQ-binding-like beta-propeller repeat protein [Rubripirellula sp.]
MLNRFATVIALTAIPACSLLAADLWPQFRGPAGDGIATNQSVPVSFSESDHVTWKTDLPGKAWSSPVIADGTIWVTTAIERVPSEEDRIQMLRESGIEEKKFKQLQIAKSIELKLLSLDLETGSLRQTIDLTTIEDPDPIHAVNSYASPTPVIDGDAIYVHFGTYGTFCIDRKSGETRWQRRLPLVHSVGPGSSPFTHKNLLVLIQDGVERQYVAALDKSTGETLWEVDRPEMDAPSGDQKKAYCTPIAITDKQGREQLICMASQWMIAYEPQTGNEIWRVRHGKGFSVVPRPVFKDDVVYFSTGFGKPELWAVRVDGQGDVTDTHVEWTVIQGIPAKPSPLLHNGLIYVVSDNGVASCFAAEDGEQVWKKRIGGDYSASPLLAGGNLYFGSHDGKVTVIEPGTDGEIVAENQLDGKIMASPAVVDNAIILRTDKAIYRIE